MIIAVISCIALFALAAFCKAAMDTRSFQDGTKAFMSYPAWFRDWMHRLGTVPVIKIDDGWHAMQALMFLFTGLAFFLSGVLYPEYGYWTLLVFILRAVVHGIVFEYFYPIL
jgi:hypothetical protein